MAKFHKLTIVNKIPETHDSVSLSFKIPLLKKSKFKYRPGQHITIKAMINGKEVRRSYSFCSSPDRSELPTITVKKVEGGLMSTYLNDVVQEGDKLEVLSPDGHFVFDADSSLARKFVMVTAGSGITPILSHIKSILEIENRGEILLIYGNKTKNDIIFSSELEALLAEYPRGFRMVNFISREDVVEDPNMKRGRITTEAVDQLIREHFDHPGMGIYLFCGPEELIDEMQEYVNEHNIPLENVHSEHFRPLVLEEGAEGADEDCSATVIFEGEELEVVIPKGGFVLDAVLKAGINAPYSCQGGVCCTCMAMGDEGEFNTDQNLSLSPEDAEKGFILTCSSIPLSAKAIINYDEA